MRTAYVCLAAVLLFVLIVAVPASAGVESVFGAVSFPLWDTVTKEAKAGINQLITFGPEMVAAGSGFYKGGFLSIPTDRYGVFDCLSYMSVDCRIFGIDANRLRDTRSAITGTRNTDAVPTFQNAMPAPQGIQCLGLRGNSLVFQIKGACPDLYLVSTAVTHNQGRVDDNGLIPKLLQIFGRKTHHQILTTDTITAEFAVVDASRYVALYARLVLKKDPCKLTDDEKYEIRSVYYDSNLKGVVGFFETPADSSWLTLALAQIKQGFAEPVKEEIDNLSEQTEAHRKEAAEAPVPAPQATPPAPAPQVTSPAAPVAPAVPAAPAESYAPKMRGLPTASVSKDCMPWQEQIRQAYPGKNGVVFVAVDAGGQPCGNDMKLRFWKQCGTGWKLDPNPLCLKNGVDTWWFQAKYSWTTFAVTLSGCPGPTTKTYQVAPGLRIIAVLVGGESYEVF